jgi:hypothetical protein
MNKTSVLKFFLFLFLLVIVLTSCTQSPAEQFIQGKWAQGNVHYWAEWNFDNGTYWYEYDDTHLNIYQTGSYIVIESGEDYILLELVDQQGGVPSIEDKAELRINFNREADTVHIRRSDFTRVSSSTLKDLTTQQAP